MLCPWVKALWNQIDIYCAALLVKAATVRDALADRDEDWQVKEEQESGFRCCCIVIVSERGGWLAAWQRQRSDRLPAGSWQKHQMLHWSLLSQSTVFQDVYAVKHKFSDVITLLIWRYPSCVFVELQSCSVISEMVVCSVYQSVSIMSQLSIHELARDFYKPSKPHCKDTTTTFFYDDLKVL